MNGDETRTHTERDRWIDGSVGDRFALVLLLVLAVLPYANALRNGYVYDDKPLIVDHPALTVPFDFWRIVTSHYWGSVTDAFLWRPLTTLSFSLGPQLGLAAPYWPHLLNVLLHAGVTLLLFTLVRRLFRDPVVAFVAAALFAVLPIHTEAVTWVSGRAELLAAAFGLAALNCAHGERRWVRWLTPVAILLAIASKESAAVLPLILLFNHWALKRRRTVPPIRLVLLSFASIAAYAVARRFVLDTWSGPRPDELDNPIAQVGFFGRIPGVLDCAGRYLGLTFWPKTLSMDYSGSVLGVAHSLTPYALLGLVATAGLLWLALRRKDRPEGWGAGLTLLTYAVVSNLVVVIGTILAERLFYVPSAGVLLVVAAGGVMLARRVRSLRWALGALLLVALIAGGARTWVRNRDWYDDRSFAEAGVRAQPESPKMQENLALVYNTAGEHDKAIEHALVAIRLNPKGQAQRDILASSLESTGRTDEALEFLRMVVRDDPLDRRARMRILGILDKRGLKDEALEIAEAAVRQDPEHALWYAEVAKRAQERGDYQTAISHWEEALRRAPEAIDVPIHFGVCLLRAGRAERANEVFKEGLRRDPGSTAAMNGYAWTLLDIGGSPQEALQYARAAAAGDSMAAYFDTLARAYSAAGDCREAIRAAETAVRLAPDDDAYGQRLASTREACRDR